MAAFILLIVGFQFLAFAILDYVLEFSFVMFFEKFGVISVEYIVITSPSIRRPKIVKIAKKREIFQLR
jgi:hypothetical protein